MFSNVAGAVSRFT